MKRILMSALGLAILIAGPAQADVKLGLAVGISGQLAPVGEQAKRGADAAIADINAKGGVNGEQLSLQLGDDACDPKQAVAVANQFASDGIRTVIGHLCSGATLAAEDVYGEEGMLMVTGSATNPAVTEKGVGTVFRVCGRDDQQALVAADLVIKEYKDKKIAVVDDKQAYGKGLAEEMVKYLKAAGIEPAYVDSINAGEKDYTPLINRLKDLKVDVLYYGGYHPELGLIARQAAQAGYHPLLIAAEGLATPEYWAIAGEAAEGTLMTYAPDPKRNPDNAALVEALRKSGPEPDNFTFYYYAAVQVVVQAMELAKTDDPAKVAEALHGNTFKTIVGELSFDEKGDLKKPDYVIYRWSNGAFDYAQ